MDVEGILPSRHAFSVTTGFKYYNGCDGTGASCKRILEPLEHFQLIDTACDQGNSPSCVTAFHTSSDTQVQVACKDRSFEFSQSATKLL